MHERNGRSAVRPVPRHLIRHGVVIVEAIGDFDERCAEEIAEALVIAADRGHEIFSVWLKRIDKVPVRKSAALTGIVNRLRLVGCAVEFLAKRPLRGPLARLNDPLDIAAVAAEHRVARHIIIARHAKGPR